ncbi:hypothetical protein P691DRAFT_766220 [Macrolepiota fuliginosa MF-IS2]|uniref:C2H2-type domain-containing protein n=1 Tax=Macrolepiota fuliginosa MF-IS2 TaxID=1400762 RepID=A0A9P5WZ09_9AGAR|nr:hypothetical protein P691DRAFT_766220 [Macrolepiota fuliginosa MF-IS2]
MSDADCRGLPHGAFNKAESDFSPTNTIYPTGANQNATAPVLVSSPASELPMDIDLPVPSDFATNNMEHISSLELALCSNFTCCSMQLPDLHALVEHFEEKHVVVFNLDGMRIYPENSGKRLAHFPPPPSLSHSPSSSRSSSVVSSPQTPTTPLSVTLVGPEAPQKPKASTSSCPQVYTPFSMSAMPESEYGIGLFDLDIGQDPYPIISSPFYDAYVPSSDSTHRPTPSSVPNPKSHDPMILDSVDAISVPTFGDVASGGVINTITSHDRDREREREKRGRTKADIVNATAVSAKNAVKARARLTGGNGKRREKAYRCPTAGCTKSYLNPNGLKYHIEKGTCRFEDSTDSEVFTENARGTAPTSPATSPTTASAPPLVTHPIPLTIGGNTTPHSAPTRTIGTPIPILQSPSNPTNTAYRIPTPTTSGYNLTRPLGTIPC